MKDLEADIAVVNKELAAETVNYKKFVIVSC